VIFYAAVEAIPPDKFAEIFDLNTVGALRVAQAVLPGMRARGHGRLLFMSSVAGRMVLPPGAAYAATKWALEALVEGLAIEVAPFGLEAALLEPGAVSSGALDDVTRYAPADDPYRDLGRSDGNSAGNSDGNGAGARAQMITPEEVAAEVVDAAESEHLPLRIPLGDPARAVLAALRAAPDTEPFTPGRQPQAAGAGA